VTADTPTGKLPGDREDIANQGECRAGGDDHAFHVVTPRSESEGTHIYYDGAAQHTGDLERPENGTFDPSPIDDRKQSTRHHNRSPDEIARHVFPFRWMKIASRRRGNSLIPLCHQLGFCRYCEVCGHLRTVDR
jgi:hypothetical protein